MEEFNLGNGITSVLGGLIVLIIEYIVFLPLKSKYEKAHPQAKENKKNIGEFSIQRLAIGVVAGKSHQTINLLDGLGFMFSVIRWAFFGGIIGVIFLVLETLISIGLGVTVSGTKEATPQFFTLGVIIGFICRLIIPVISIIVEFAQSKSTVEKEPSLITIRRSVNVFNIKNDELEIFYDMPFVRPPNLVIDIKNGDLDYAITDQRADGFKIELRRRSSSGKGTILEWIATGELTR